MSLKIITAQGDERWLDAAEVIGFGDPAMATFFLPFTGGDLVLVGSMRSPGEVRGWTVTGRRLETQVEYRVHLAGTPSGDEVTADVFDLETRPLG